MTHRDDRNILTTDQPRGATRRALSQDLVDSARTRVAEAGGELFLWAVMSEDKYETTFGDGLYLHLCGLALNGADAQRLLNLASTVPQYRWHIRNYRLGLVDGFPALLDSWPRQEEFTITDVLEVLAEIPSGGTGSRVLAGSGWQGRTGPEMLALDNSGDA